MNVFRLVRWVLLVVGAAAAVAVLSACNPPPPTKKIVVTTTVDAADANVGDGICEASAGAGNCTLRAAIQEANASPIRADITVPPWTFPLTVAGEDDVATVGDLDVAPASGLVWIHAPQPGAQVVGPVSGESRVFEVRSGTVGITGIGARGALHLFDVDPGATLDLGAVSGSADQGGTPLYIDAGATAHVLDATLSGPVINLGTLDARFSTLQDLSTNSGASSTLTASIVWETCSGPLASGGYNLTVAGAGPDCTIAGPGDATTANFGLGPLSATPLAAQPPQLGSPALDAIPAGVGPCAGAPSDEHGWARPTHGACDKGALESQAPRSLTVGSSADTPDATPGDGTCLTAAGACTLRAAVDETNAWTDGWATDTVTLAADPTLSISGLTDDANATGDLDITGDLNLVGAGHRVSGGGIDRVFQIVRGTSHFDHLTITGGQATTDGGGIATSQGAGLTISWSTIVGNTTTGDGGGVSAESSSSISIDHSSVRDNRALGHGGGVSGAVGYLVFSPGGQVIVRQSTLSGNQAPFGAAAWAAGYNASVQLWSSTVLDNGPAGSLGSATFDLGSCIPRVGCDNGGRIWLYGSLVQPVAGGTACGSIQTERSYALAADPTCGTAATALRLGPLVDNGGPTPTALPYEGSPAIDLIPPGTASLCDASTPTDQRGVGRPSGAGCDAGAAEGSLPRPPGRSFLVTSPADKIDLVPGDGICDAGSGGCTLRAAIDEANASVVTLDTITIKSGINPKLTRTGGPEDRNSKGDLDITSDIVIEGNGSTIDAGQLDRVIDQHGATLTLRNLIVTGGKLVADNSLGGGIRSTGALILERVSVSGNQLVGNNIAGAGIAALAGPLTITNSTFSGNNAGGYLSRGGGVFLSGAKATVTNSTFVDNTAFDGAAVNVAVGDPTVPDPVARLDVRLSTVVGNHGYGSVGGGASTQVTGSALSAPDGFVCSAAIASGGFNQASGDASFCGLTQPTDQLVSDLLLGPLAANGGATQTLLPQAGSPLLDVIPIGTSGLCDATVTTDQRGSVRPHGAACDAGSVER